jgi:DNA-binding response OmpR family regulator
MLNVVVVEDYDLLREEMVFHLGRPGWQVDGVGDGVALDRHLASNVADVVILDLNLPGEDGLSIARRLREQDPLRVLIMLTARHTAQQRAAGFTAGADVYLAKPAQVSEIEAILRNVERRLRPLGRPVEATAAVRLSATPTSLTLSDGTSLSLSASQGRLLQALAQAYPKTLDLGSLCQITREPSQPRAGMGPLRVQISRLRHKWQQAGGRDRLIEPVRGRGYRLTQPIATPPAGPSSAGSPLRARS